MNGSGGQVALYVTGSASLTLTGSNTFTGASTIDSGSLLQIGNGTSGEQIATQTIVDNGALAFNHADSLTYSGVLSGSGSLQKLGSGLLILNGASNVYSGGTTVSAGTLQIGDGLGNDGSLPGNVSVLSNATLQFDTQGVFTYGRVVSGSGGLAEVGSGGLIVTGSNTYTGPTTISTGTLQVGNGGGGSIGSSSGVINNGSLVFYQSGSVTFAPPISGSGSLTQAGTNLLTLTGSSSGFNGPTTINGGTLQLGTGASGQDGALPATSGIANNGTLAYNLYGSQTASYAISGAGNLVKLGPGTVSLANANPSFSGSAAASGGVLQLANPLALQNSTVTVSASNGLGFATGVTSPTIGGLSGTGNVSLADVAGNPVTLSVGANGGNTTYYGALTGSGGLTKTGAGTFVVAANSTYSGATTVSQGTLQLSPGVVASFNGGENWTSNGVNGSASVSGGTATLTNDTQNQSGSVFYNTPVPTGPFTASFTLQQSTAGTAQIGDGLTFVLQNSTSGASAASYAGQGSGLGYQGIAPSAAVQFTVYHNGTISVGSTYTSGGTISPNNPTGTVNLTSGDPIQVTLSYNGSTLVETLQDTVVPADTFSTSYGSVNLAAVTGGGTAYLGFTGATGQSTALQTVSNVSFVSQTSINTLPVTTALNVVADATFDLYGGSQTVASLTGSGTVTNSNPGTIANLTVSNGGTFAGTIQDGLDRYNYDDPVSLIVSGGELVLTGTNTYEGGTLVSGGTLALENNEAIVAGSSLTVGNAAAFSELSLGTAPAARPAALAAVPEPGTLALLVAAVAFAAWRRRRAHGWRRSETVAAFARDE